MSADTCVVIYGLSFELTDEEVEACELRKDPRMLAARSAGFQHYWGAFGSDGERYRLFVGLLLGIFGPEHQLAAQYPPASLQAAFAETSRKLKVGGFEEDPQLLIEYAVDQ
jgi:hypothetical protein